MNDGISNKVYYAHERDSVFCYHHRTAVFMSMRAKPCMLVNKEKDEAILRKDIEPIQKHENVS